jgi:tRNA-dihydrouridine synthase
MAGVSEAPFRRICRSFGADVVVSEFLSCEGLRRGCKSVHDGAFFTEPERPIGIQLYGADPAAMAEAARLVTEHYAPDFVDINFGCPVKKVVRRNGGSGCLKDLDLVQAIIRAVRGATHLPVTAKIRSGWDEATRDPVTIARRCQDAGAQVITLHPRTRTDMFSGQARVMIARGSFGNPWIFQQARALLEGRTPHAPPGAAERFAVALRHSRLAVEVQGDDRQTTIEFRKHLGWYVKSLPGASDLRRRLHQVGSMAEVERIFVEYQSPALAVG